MSFYQFNYEIFQKRVKCQNALREFIHQDTYTDTKNICYNVYAKIGYKKGSCANDPFDFYDRKDRI